jgi:hypothetical protein
VPHAGEIRAEDRAVYLSIITHAMTYLTLKVSQARAELKRRRSLAPLASASGRRPAVIWVAVGGRCLPHKEHRSYSNLQLKIVIPLYFRCI